jgi:hypothetical protein
VAKVIYAVMALALGALVAGFFVDTSNVPLIGSIVLSGAVMLLILFGWSRRIRKGLDLMDGEQDEDVAMDEILPAEKDEPALVGVKPIVSGVEPKVEPKRSRKDTDEPSDDAFKRPAAETGVMKAIAEESTTVLPKTRPATRASAPVRKKAPAKVPAGKAKAKPKAKAAPATGPRVLVIPGRSRFHHPGCRFAKGDDLREVSEAVARRRGYEPCNVCARADA